MAASTLPTRPRETDTKERRISHRFKKSLPPDVKAYYVKEYKGDAETAFRTLLTGSNHVCEHCKCYQPNHQTLRMYLEMAGALETRGILVNIFQKIGVQNEGEMVALVEAGKRMREIQQDASASLDMILEEALETAALVIAERPDLRAVAAARLGLSEAVIPLVSNGHLGQ